MLFSFSIVLIVQVVVITRVRAGYEDIDIPMISKLKFELREYPKPTQCTLLAERIAERVGDINDGKDEVLVKTLNSIKETDSLAKSALIRYLDECIRDYKLYHTQSVNSEEGNVKGAQKVAAIKEEVEEEVLVERKKNNELVNELKSLRAKHMEAESENESLKQRLDDVEVDKLETQKETDRLKEELNKSCRIVKKNELDRNKLAGIANSSKQYQIQVSDLIKLNEDMRRDLRACLSERVIWTRNVKNTKSLCDRIHAEVQEKLDIVKTRADIAENNKNSLLSQRDDAFQELNNLKSRLSMCQPYYFNGCCRGWR